MAKEGDVSRRVLLRDAAIGAAGLLLAGCAGGEKTPAKQENKPHTPADETANEDLMKEHGLLMRALLIYDESGRRIEAGNSVPAGAIASTAAIVRQFVESYHERNEEERIFPRMRNAGVEAELCHVLLAQHQAGRKVTDRITELAKKGMPADAKKRGELRGLMIAFSRMYRPHMARENTVLFPAFRMMLSREEYEDVGDEFEKRELAVLGKTGFEGVLRQVEGIEKGLGIADLAKFTLAE